MKRFKIIFVICTLCVNCVSSSIGEDYLLDETLMLPGRTAEIDTLLSSSDLIAWPGSFGICNGFHLISGLPSEDAEVLLSKSVSMHTKFYGTIFEEDAFDFNGQLMPSAIDPALTDEPELREFLLQYGGVVLRLFDTLPLEEPFDTPEEMIIWGRDESDCPKVLKILRNEAAGGTSIFPRDFFREVDQLQVFGPETIFEYRIGRAVRYDLSEYGIGDGPETYHIPYRWVVGVSVRRAIADGTGTLPFVVRPTRVDEILDPAEQICPGDCSSWYLPDTDPPAAGDEGELCFDVDAITSLDEYMLPMAGTGALKIALPIIADLLELDVPMEPFDPFLEAFPGVLDTDFDSGPRSLFRGYMAARCLMNRGFRLLDTVNPPEGPAAVDIPPLTHGVDFATDYDGVPIEMGFQVRHVRASGLRGRQLMGALGAFGIADLAKVPVIAGDYRMLVRNVRFYVRGPRGRTQVTLPQLFQLIQTQWDKGPAYVPPHNLLEDHPRLDLGQLGPFNFEIRALAKLKRAGRRFVPIRAIISAYPGLYSTNHYGGDPFAE